MPRQSETKKRGGEKTGQKPGKYHYDPVGMSGKEAGIVEEVEKEKAREQASDAGSGKGSEKAKKSGS